MLFNSIDFSIFLPIVFVLYWFVFNKSIKGQNILLVISSYVFYAWWDWRFLSLILFSTIIDYFVGIRLGSENNRNRRKLLLWSSVIVNLGFLGFFKYYNFFTENFITAFSIFGAKIQPNTLNIILPVGISFYTFQTLSYTIDVYRRRLKPTNSFIGFSVFVSFFPQLVAGPIERAKNLLPQFHNKRRFDYAKVTDGIIQIIWGLFKKVVVADNCAKYADIIFNNSDDYYGSTLVLGTFFFAFQIYGDFSGYSDIAIGASRLFGINLKTNFSYPYFSRDIAEFWRRWHISLSTWFRDYLYIPLGGSRVSTIIKVRNIFIIFIVSGFWHGANWTFIAWGVLNAIYFLPLLLKGNNRKNLDIVSSRNVLPSVRDLFKMCFTFMLTSLAWVFFRSKNMEHALSYLSEIFSLTLFNNPTFNEGLYYCVPTAIYILILLIIDWLGRSNKYGLACVKSLSSNKKKVILLCIIILILENFNASKSQEFIYFDF